MKTKRIFALLLALMMVLSLAACAKQSASDDGAASAAVDFPKEDIKRVFIRPRKWKLLS